MKFVKRDTELNMLEKEYKKENSFIVIYGRRRVGKTRLIEEFIRNKKSIYFLAARQDDIQQIEDFKRIINTIIPDDFMLKNKFLNWNDFFSYLEKIWPKKEKLILAIDEITYIIKENRSFTSYLQRFLDNFLSKTNTMLILSGSIVGMMIKDILSYESPLYGRRTAQIHLKEFNFFDSRIFMKNFNFKNQISLYSFIGGVAKYLSLIENENNLQDILVENFFNPDGFFNKEVYFLFSEEFKESSTYINILKGISYGNSKINEISNFTGFETKKISRYLDILLGLNFIKKEIPVCANEKKYRGAVYVINDNYLIFWHRFVLPNRSLIEFKKGKKVYTNIEKNLKFLVSFNFENICRDFLLIKNDFSFEKLGKQWGKYNKNLKNKIGTNTYEIDICGINEEKNKKILFGECKWQDNVSAKKIFFELKEKAKHVNWYNDKREEKFVIFARSFKDNRKEKLELEKLHNCICYDLDDIEINLK